MPLDSYLREVGERADAAPRGPYQVTGVDKHTRDKMAYVKVRGTQPGGKWHIADVRFVDGDGFNDEQEARDLAGFIAHARTDVPKLLRMVRVLMFLVRITGKLGAQVSSEGVDALAELDRIAKEPS